LSALKGKIVNLEAGRRSRASTTPIDATPETYMGASVAKSGSEEIQEPEETLAAPKRRVKRERGTRTRGTAAVDPDAMNKLMNMKAPIKEEDVGSECDIVAPTPPKKAVVPEVESKPESVETAISKDEYLTVKDELSKIKVDLENTKDKLEEYDDLTEQLAGGKGARSLTDYIGGLMDKDIELEEANKKVAELHAQLKTDSHHGGKHEKQLAGAREEIQQLRNDLDQLQSQLESEKAKNEEIMTATASIESQGGSTEGDLARLSLLEAEVSSKSQEVEDLQSNVTKLQRDLRDAKNMQSLSTSEQLPTVSGGDVFGKMEQEMQMMEQLIKEQEQFMENLEGEMEKALEGLPEGMRNEFLKEKEKMIKEIEEEEQNRMSMLTSPQEKEGAVN